MLKGKFRKLGVVVGVLALIGVTGCSSDKGEDGAKGRSKVVQLTGSDTIVNASQAIVEEYIKENPKARITVTGGGSGVGISALINKTTDIAMASREMKDKEMAQTEKTGHKIEEITIGYDGITIIVNKNNPISDISKKDLGKIFSGEITNWKDLGGADENIVALSRDTSSGTHVYFKEDVVRQGKTNEKEYGEMTQYLPSNTAILQQVSKNTNAIGYIGMGYMDPSVVKSLEVDHVSPTPENVGNKSYPIARGVYWYAHADRKGLEKDLVDFVRSSKAQKIMKKEGFVPLS